MSATTAHTTCLLTIFTSYHKAVYTSPLCKVSGVDSILYQPSSNQSCVSSGESVDTTPDERRVYGVDDDDSTKQSTPLNYPIEGAALAADER